MISVCIATYNGEKYLIKQINSILKQLGPDDEIIISDDSSTDNTFLLLKDFKDNRIAYHKHNYVGNKKKYSANHYRVTANFENALRLAKGDIIFLSDQDDIWHDDRINKMSKVLEKAQLAYAPFEVIDDNDIPIFNSKIKNPIISNHFLLDLFFQPFFGCCMAFRRSLLDLALPFPKDLVMHDNWIGLLAEISMSRIDILNRPLLFYRYHHNNVSINHENNPLWFKICYRIRILVQLLNRILSSKGLKYLRKNKRLSLIQV